MYLYDNLYDSILSGYRHVHLLDVVKEKNFIYTCVSFQPDLNIMSMYICIERFE